MAGPVSVSVQGLDKAIKRVGKIREVVTHPDIDAGVREMAGVWAASFDAEGSAVGGWRDLTAVTNKLRESRGYPPAHPILVQSGTLRRVAIGALQSGPRSESGDGANLSYRSGPLSANLTIRGPKVSNQFRIRDSTSDSPARPFWFVNHDVEQALTSSIWNKMAEALRRT